MHQRHAVRKQQQMQGRQPPQHHQQQHQQGRRLAQGPLPAPSCALDGACAAAMDEYADHAVQCMVGGDHTALHDALADEVAAMHQQAGLRARREVFVPQLSSPSKTEPRADLMAWGSVALPVARLDITVVSPWALRNAEAARAVPAESARRAELSKGKEYGARGGVCIQGLAVEAGGRHGPQFDGHLKLLASLARQRDSFAGREPRFHLKQWRTRIAVLLGRFTAHTISAALGGHTLSSDGPGSAQATQLRVGPARRAAARGPTPSREGGSASMHAPAESARGDVQLSLRVGPAAVRAAAAGPASASACSFASACAAAPPSWPAWPAP